MTAQEEQMQQQTPLTAQEEQIPQPDPSAAQGEKPILEAIGVCRDFNVGTGVVHALSDVTIRIMPGTLTVLRGRSGSGKTTLLNLLAALDRPTKGKVIFKDRVITDFSDTEMDHIRRTEIGYVFQSVALVSLMSAYENVEFSMRLAKKPRSEWKPRVEEVLTMVGLKKRMKHRPAELSGGEQQRVAIARAVAHKPIILFADEPTAELDTQMGLRVMSIFRDLVEKEGITLVMTTHDPNIMELADHVYTLEDGFITGETFISQNKENA